MSCVSSPSLSKSSSSESQNVPNPVAPRPLSMCSRLGWLNLTTLLITSITVITCLALLSFLWFADSSNSVWLRIALHGWIPRSVTLISMVLCWAITTQAVICTSEISALLLEQSQVELWDVATISTLRVLNNGPFSLLLTMFQRLDTSNFALKVLTLSMATSTVLLQFTSTALLSDIKKSNIQVSHYDSNISYAVEGGGDLFAPGNRASDAAYLRTNPTAYPAFAEYSEESSIDEQSGVSETGPSMRAFLPFQGEASRGTIVEYTGTTTVFDTRVVCMRPSLSNLSMPNAGTIRGIFQTHWTVPQFNDTLQSQGPVPFSYNFGSDFPVLVTHEWPLFVCFLDPTSDGPISPLYRSFQPAQFVYNFNIVINISEFLAEHASDKYSNYPIRIKDLEEDNEWVVIHTVDNYTSLSLTMCYSSSVAKNMYMTASRSGDYTSEPLPKWNSTLHSYDTSAVRNQLGAARIASQADRGIFNLELQTSFDAASLAENTSSIPFTALAELNPTKGNPFPDTNPSTLTIAMCRCCLGDADRFANHLHVAVFNDIVRDTRHPALALQSLYTTLFGMTYYDRLDQYNISAQATTVQKVEIQCPVTHTFYYIVLAFYILHLALVGLIAALFCIRCRQSLLGNFWSAAAQLWSPDTEIWLRQADTADGGTVRKWMKAAREAKIRFGIGHDEGRAQIMRKSE